MLRETFKTITCHPGRDPDKELLDSVMQRSAIQITRVCSHHESESWGKIELEGVKIFSLSIFKKKILWFYVYVVPRVSSHLLPLAVFRSASQQQ